MIITSQRINPPINNNMSSLLTDVTLLVQGEKLLIECWTCIRKKQIPATPYRLGKKFKLSHATNSIGWISSFDFKRGRFLAFCSSKCEEKAKRKDGFFKVNRPS